MKVKTRISMKQERFRRIVPQKHWKISAEKKGLYANKMMKLLRGLYNVKDLRLSEFILKALGGAPNMLGCQPHQLYHNLRTLKLRTWLTRGCLHSITYLLRISPHIESLSLELSEGLFDVQCRRGGYLDFNEVTFDSEILGNNREAWLLLPCMMDHLKYAEIQGVRGCLNELKFLEFLLTNAIALEKLVLTPCLRYSKQEVLMKFHEKLLTYPRASKDTKILLESEQICKFLPFVSYFSP
ncbi:hypothetical protein MKW98_000549 [Papaver atlanticum]|uniref:FBD domain-containing protein n=1 Tax=Papaver atlanticum TaxID=357466 RepID=A0AAD4X8R5_9MAGN|nr:hypothetical protein MKW98_000549 [Papaver atlanticum]